MASFKVLIGVTLAVVLAAIVVQASPEPQRNNFRNNNNNNRRPLPPPPPPPPRRNNNNNRGRPNNNNRVVNNNRPAPAFRATPANARDAEGNEVYPGCNGTVCLPVAQQCAARKRMSGHFTFQGKSYWISWASSDSKVRNARWNWFTGRNYCRKFCMDMVSLETKAEENWVAELMRASGIKDVHTSGRLCDAEVEGCDQPRFQPLKINGWFWANTLQMMPPTDQQSNRFYNNWSPTGANGVRQPDGGLKANGWGKEACMALLDNKHNDGLRWHDEPCNTRRLLVCEDLPTPNINFVRNNNPNVNIP